MPIAEQATTDAGAVDFYFDVMCPWAYQASVWIREVRRRTGLEVRWRFFSLEEVNRAEGKKHAWEREWSYGWSLLRVAALLRRTDMDLVDRWYETTGRALHVDGRKPHVREVAEELAVEAGLDRGVVQAALDDATTHDEVRADHDRVVAHGFFGVPTLELDDGSAIFGPVLIDPPTGEAAVRLWAHVCAWREFPHVYEMKRPKGPDDIAAIGRTFEPYLTARDWNTVQRPAP